MANLPSGPDGFLIGKASESLDRIASEIAVLKAIHSDTTATLKTLTKMALSMSGLVPAAPTNERAPGVRTATVRTPATPRDPSSRSFATPGAKPGLAGEVTPVLASETTPRLSVAPVAPAAPVATPARDESGRWRSKAGAAPADSPARSDGDSRASVAMGSAAESMRGVASAVASGSDGIDPTVQAVKEIGSVFAPLSAVFKPMGRLFGRGKTPEQKNQRENVTWYRRIWGAVKNPAAGGGGMGLIMTALLSMLGMLLAPIKALSRLLGMGSLGKLLGGLAGGGRAGAKGARGTRSRLDSGATGSVDGKKKPGTAGGTAGAATTGTKAEAGAAKAAAPVGTKTGTAAGAGAAKVGGKGIVGKGVGLGKSALGMGASLGKGLLKRIPFIGAALGLGMAASSAMASDDPNLSADENKKERYGGVGGGIGGVVGGVVGLLGGPAGAIAGAMIGDKLGGMVGEWLATVDLGSLPGMIGDAFTSLKDGALEAATGAFDSIKEGWKGLVDTGAKLFAGMSDWAKDTWKAATEAVLGIKDTVADKVQTASDYVGDKATSVKDAGQNLLNKATGGSYTGGSNARKDELIKAMDAGGITDPKSKAMLMANVDHESGGFKKNEENLNYSAKRLQEVFPKYYSTPEAARADANNPEAIANKVYGGRMGNKDAGDGFKYRGRGDIQLTGKSQYEDMGKKLGVDLVNNPDLAKDPKISAQIAVQHWKSSGADKAAMAGDQDRARKLTNGGTNGLEDVKSKYDGYLAQAKAGDLTPTRRADQGKVQAPEGATAALASTMSAVKGSPAVGVMPIGPRGPLAPTMPGTQTVGVMAPTVPTVGMASIKPINAGTIAAPSYSPPAPDASLTKIAPTPAVEKPLLTPGKAAAPASLQLSVPLSQNLEDRQIAHVASGGMGMGGK